MAAKGGLFALMGGPPPPMRGGGGGASMGASSDPAADDEDDSGDSMPASEDTDPTDTPAGSGPFDAYAETVFDPKSDTPTKTDALRQAILTLIEERGGK
jgi:hypothetical protein